MKSTVSDDSKKIQSKEDAVRVAAPSVKKKKKLKNGRVIPGFGLTLGITIAMLSLIILIPLASVLVYAFKMTPADFIKTIT